MPLTVGTRLGPYEVTGPLGKGGMGEVYRAKDLKLGRDVAIKVLPNALARDPERLGRFEREAKVLASLNHPNIATIYSLEESPEGKAIAMELVEGTTLKSPQPLETALNYAKQIADALAAAHEKGVTHRDLKPANIMVTPAGLVKVLDFGLAAVARPAAPTGEDSPTLTMGMTEAGMIMGTAAYMAPEQAAGLPADRRADIWSFGVVLYELLTGNRLFSGKTTAHILAAVIHKEPDLERIPAKLRPLLQRCLQKEPKKRLQAIGDWDALLHDPPPPVATAAANQWLWPAAATLMTLAAAGVAFLHFQESATETRVISSTLLAPTGTEYDFTSPPGALPALSPDGTRLVFGAKSKDGKMQLWMRRLDSPTAQPLPGTEGAFFPFWSADSRWVAFGQELKLKKVDIEGGPAVSITDLEAAFGGGSWNAEGTIVFGLNGSGSLIYRVAAAGGAATPITPPEPKQEGTSNHRYPWFLPDGRHFLYTLQVAGDIPVRVASLDEPGMAGKTVAQAHSNARYSEGRLLYLRENTLMAQPFDTEKLETNGEAVPLTENVPTYGVPSRLAAFTVSAAGLLVHQTGSAAVASKLLWKDRTGKTLSALGEPVGAITSIQISPDGSRLAATETRSGNSDIWIYDVARGVPARFTFDAQEEAVAAWSQDGRTLYFSATGKLFQKASNGTGAVSPIPGEGVVREQPAVSPDGKFLIYASREQKTGSDLWVLPLDAAGGKARPFLATPFSDRDPRFSPEGRWVIYTSRESGRDEVYAAPFPGPGGKRQISVNGGRLPRWQRDGKEI